MFLIFMAGLDTVASTMGLIVRGFAQDAPKRREFVSIMGDPKQLDPAVEELVRFHSIVTTPRRVTETSNFTA
jgi:cytochrome P450